MAVGVRRSVELRGAEELVPQPPLVRISIRIDAAPREERKQKCLWVSDSSLSILSRCWVLVREGRVCAKHLGPRAPPRSHYPRVWKESTICRAQVPQGSGICVCNRCLPPPVACRSCRSPVVRRPDTRHPPHQVVERPLQLCSVSDPGPVGHETWTTRQTLLPEGYAQVPEAPSAMPLEATRIAESF